MNNTFKRSGIAVLIAAMVFTVLACDNLVDPPPPEQETSDVFRLVWQGELNGAPENPVAGWVYFNKTDQKLYVYYDKGWNQLGSDGDKGDPGADGTQLVWKGSHLDSSAAELAAPENGWLYYDQTAKASFIYLNAWQKFAQDGAAASNLEFAINTDGSLILTVDGGTPLDLGKVKGDPGADGKDGLTPRIGENGNWWIGDTDTGVKAEGQTPHVGDNGNWWIGETDTGIPVVITISITINGSGVSGSDIKAAIEEAIAAAKAGGGTNDGSAEDKALTISFTDIDLDDDIAMKALFTGIKDYYVHLDLSGLTGTFFSHYPLSFSTDKYRILSITLGNDVTEIAATAFKTYWGLRKIIALGVTSINWEAFSDCTSLTEVDLPAVTFIGDKAFLGCTSLTKAEFPLVTTIKWAAFSDCTSLTKIDAPLVTTVGYEAFLGCTSLTEVDLPAVTSLEGNNFKNCTSLTKAEFPLVTIINWEAFSGCTSLTKVDFPSATTIRWEAFSGCTSLTEAEFPLVTIIENGHAFQNCTSLTKAKFPLVTFIEWETFYGCTSLTEVDLPAVTSIEAGAFTNCSSLTEINLPSVTNIGWAAFADLFSLTNVTIGDSITSIVHWAFNNCTSLTNVTIAGTISADNFGTNYAFPGDLRDKYLAANGGPGTYTRPNGDSGTWTKQ